MSIEVAQPQELFASLPRENLAKIARQEGLPCEEKVSKKKIVESIVEEVEDAGIKQITSQLKKVQLEEICDSLDIDHGSNNPTKTVLRKRLMEIMQKQGLEDFFSKNMNADQIKIFLVSNGVTPASKGDKDALVKQAVDLVNYFGLQTFLNRFDTAFLQECMKEMKLRCNTDSKAKIVMAISTHSDAKKDKVNRDITFSEKKREIKKGITYQDIFQHYLKEEVEEWCRKNGLKVTGKKKELIERILAYLDGDTENTMAPNREKESKPEKKEKKETKKESKKESEKKETKEKAESPKNKKKTEEKSKKPKEESEEEEEEEQDE